METRLNSVRLPDGRLNIEGLEAEILSCLGEGAMSGSYKLTGLTNYEAHYAKNYFGRQALREKCIVEIVTVTDIIKKTLDYEAVFRRK